MGPGRVPANLRRLRCPLLVLLSSLEHESSSSYFETPVTTKEQERRSRNNVVGIPRWGTAAVKKAFCAAYSYKTRCPHLCDPRDERDAGLRVEISMDQSQGEQLTPSVTVPQYEASGVWPVSVGSRRADPR